MRLFVILAFLSTVTTAAAAEEFKPVIRPGFQLRVDGNSVETDKAGKDSIATGFAIYRARMAVGGDLDENLSFFVRYDVMYPYSSRGDINSDGAVGNLERAYLEHRPLPGLTLRFGRFPFMAGAIEWDYSSMDQYSPSHYSDLINFPVFVATSGVDATYKLGPQSLTLQVLNGVPGLTDLHSGAAVPKADAGKQHGENLTTAVGFRGNYLDGVVKPIVSYDRFSRVRNGDGAEHDERATYTSIGAGVQVSAFHFDLDLESDTFAVPAFQYYTWDATTNAATKIDAKKDVLQSYVGQLAFNATELRLRPFVKVSSEVESVDGKQAATWKRDALGVEYRPLAYKAFRYHAVLVDKRDTDESVPVKVRTNVRQYILGVAAKI